jgi:hypothetical protein
MREQILHLALLYRREHLTTLVEQPSQVEDGKKRHLVRCFPEIFELGIGIAVSAMA